MNWKITGVVLTTIGMFAVVLLAWGDHKGDTKVLAKEVETHVKADDARFDSMMKNGTEACDTNEVNIAIMQVDIAYTKEKVEKIETAQQVNFDRLLKAIKENQ